MKLQTMKVPNGKICYLEVPSRNVEESAGFFNKVFGWNIRIRGDKSVAFDDVHNGVSGTWKTGREPYTGSTLMIYIMVDSVAATLDAVVANGGRIVEPITGKDPEFIAKFSDPTGNVWGVGQE